MAEEAELWALLVGLWISWIMGIKQLVAEIDSRQVYEWVNSRETMRNLHSNLVEECKEMMKWNWKVDLQLNPWEVN